MQQPEHFAPSSPSLARARSRSARTTSPRPYQGARSPGRGQVKFERE
jgi:hypothetical protein